LKEGSRLRLPNKKSSRLRSNINTETVRLVIKISNKILTPVQILGTEYYSYICDMLKTKNISWWWSVLRQTS
jgi:hypothetical protein